MAKLTETEVRQIKERLRGGETQRQIAESFAVSRSQISDIACERAWSQVPWPVGKPATTLPLNRETISRLLRRSQTTTAEIASQCGVSERQAETFMLRMQNDGHLIFRYGETWALEKQPAISHDRHVWEGDANGCYLFGFTGDSHLCSKYERLDVLNDLYEKFASRGVKRVFHAGNWIDGEARFNKHDLHTHGMDAQIKYLIDHYPRHTGIHTYSVAGDDHEGWYGQREGIDIGRHAERMMRDAGRLDWHHLGYMEAFVALTNYKTRATSQLLLMHPGGGSAYAHSYKPQKIVEGFSGGEKPAVLLIGHYHKISQNLIRNVWAIQCGCAQDQTPFMRKRGIDAHVGGGVCKLQQDDKGAIVGCQVEFFLYYNRGYYNHRWSHARGVQLPDRGVQHV